MFATNIAVSAYEALQKGIAWSRSDIWLLSLVLLFLLNPLSYWQEMSTSAVYVRVGLFALRFALWRPLRLSKYYLTFAFGILMSSALSITLWQLGFGDQWRLNYPYGDSNYQGFIFATYSLLLWAHWPGIDIQRFWPKILVVVASISAIVVVCLGASRGAIVSLIVVGIIGVVRSASRRHILVIAITLGVSSMALSRIQVVRESAVVERFFNPRDSDRGAANSRVTEVSAAFKELERNPASLLFGFGLSRSSEKDNRFFDSRFRIHNTAVSVLFDSGLVGLLCFAGLCFALWREVGHVRGALFLLFIFLNCQTFYVLSFYHFYICLKLIGDLKYE